MNCAKFLRTTFFIEYLYGGPLVSFEINHFETEYDFEIEFKVDFKVKLEVKSEFKIEF